MRLEIGALAVVVAVGLVVPIAAGAVDLAIGAEVGLGAVLVAWLLVGSVPIPLAITLSLTAGAAVGVFSWLMIIRSLGKDWLPFSTRRKT